MQIIAGTLTLVLLTLAAIHLYWAIGGVGSSAGIPSHPDGTPLFRPGRVATVAVALALCTAAALIAAHAQLIALGLPASVLRVGSWGVAISFAARTIGEFRYVGVFKRVRGTPFAVWDTRLFTPLCAAIAAAAFVVARS